MDRPVKFLTLICPSCHKTLTLATHKFSESQGYDGVAKRAVYWGVSSCPHCHAEVCTEIVGTSKAWQYAD